MKSRKFKSPSFKRFKFPSLSVLAIIAEFKSFAESVISFKLRAAPFLRKAVSREVIFFSVSTFWEKMLVLSDVARKLSPTVKIEEIAFKTPARPPEESSPAEKQSWI